MARLRRKLLATVVILVIVGGVWIYTQRVNPVEMAAYIPESAIGYLEINNLPAWLDDLTSTDGWKMLASGYGVDSRLGYAGKLGQVVRATGFGRAEWVALSRAQCAVVVTSLEVREEAVRPRAALLIESHLAPDRLRGLIASRLPELSKQLFGEVAPENSEYAGVQVRVYRAEGDRRLFSAQVEGEWILANHPEAMEACLDARLGRAPNLSSNFYLKQARPLIGGDLFGFISGKGTGRLAQFGAHLIGRRVLGESPLVDALQSVAGNLSDQTSQGLAFGERVDGGVVVDRSIWFLLPQMVEQLRGAVEVGTGESKLLAELPAGVEGVTILRTENPGQSFDALNAIISSRLGVVESLLFQRFLFGAREALFGLRVGEVGGGAFGDEMASLNFGESDDDRLWLVETGDRAKLEALAVRFLSERGARLERVTHDGIEILISSDERRGAAAFVRSSMALGTRNSIVRLIEAGKKGGAFVEKEAFRRVKSAAGPAPIISYSSVGDEAGRMMSVLARRLPEAGSTRAARPALDQLPLSVGRWTLGERGFEGETRGPIGAVAWIAGLLGAADDEEAGNGRGGRQGQ